MHTPPAPANSPPEPARTCCPACGGTAFRRVRRLADRILSWFRPVYRFRCDAAGCGWEGNFPQSVLTRGDAGQNYRR